MYVHNVKLTATEVAIYLDVNYQTFNFWLNEGILGEKFITPGRGTKRGFNFFDVCAAKIAAETVPFSIQRAKYAVSAFFILVYFYTKYDPTLQPTDEPKIDIDTIESMSIYSNGSVFIFNKEGTCFECFRGVADQEDVNLQRPLGKVALMVPLKEILQEIDRLFIKLAQ